MKGLNIPTVWVLSEFLVCLDRGQLQFTIPDAERKSLIERDFRSRADGAAGSKYCVAQRQWHPEDRGQPSS